MCCSRRQGTDLSPSMNRSCCQCNSCRESMQQLQRKQKEGGHLKGVELVLQKVLQLLPARAHAMRTVMGRRGCGRAQRWTRIGFKRAGREERERPEERAARDQAAG